MLDLDLEPDRPIEKDCGRCSICLDKCPTGAIVAPYTIHAPLCISFQTIEQRGVVPIELRPKMGDWVFGCDVCQEVCPYTGAAKRQIDPSMLPRRIENAYPSLRWLLTMADEQFRSVYRGTPVLRTKRRGLARNAAIAFGNAGTVDDLSFLAALLSEHDEPLVRGHLAWSVGQIGGSVARKILDIRRSNEIDDYVRGEIETALIGLG